MWSQPTPRGVTARNNTRPIRHKHCSSLRIIIVHLLHEIYLLLLYANLYKVAVAVAVQTLCKGHG